VRGALGFSDSFNTSDAMLQKVAQLCADHQLGAHFHLCEADDDFALTRGSSGLTVVERLERFGLLKSSNIAAFARRLARDEVAVLAKSGIAVALSPLAGALEGERDETLEWLLAHGAQEALGSAGLGTLWEQLPLAFASCAREARGRRLLEPDAAVAELFLGAPAELCSRVFGAPSGSVEPGSLADLVVCDTVPAVEDEQSQGLHLLMQVASAPVAWTLVNGRVVVREGQLLGADALELAREAAKAQAAIWRRAS
jgi:cytosine/adenosine deaminase-related metal-dependent hydrolase